MRRLYHYFFVSFLLLTFHSCKQNPEFGNEDYIYVSLDKKDITLKEGQSQQLKVEFFPTTVKDTRLVWRSSDESVAVVDESGLVTGITAGETRISVNVRSSGESDYCNVTVTEAGYAPESLSGMQLKTSETSGQSILTFYSDTEMAASWASICRNYSWKKIGDNSGLLKFEGIQYLSTMTRVFSFNMTLTFTSKIEFTISGSYSISGALTGNGVHSTSGKGVIINGR